MESARILVAFNNDISLNKLRAELAGNGYKVVDQAKDGNETLRKIGMLKPDLAVIDYNLQPTNGFEIAKIALEDKLCDVILIVNSEQKDSIELMNNGYDFVIIPKPINRNSFISTVDLVLKSRKKVMKLEKEIEKLKETLDSRKEIEKAKGTLMKHMNLTEDQAFRLIQKKSMDSGIQMKEIAKAIILAYDL